MRDNLTELIFSAGVVGCGGAGFPTHKKICGQVEDFIVNGVECEPLLRTDRYIMAHYARELVETVAAIGAFLQAKRCAIGVKRAYVPQVEALEAAIRETGTAVELHLLESFYPAGDEQVLVHEVTGRTVPPGGIPLAVGAVVDNAATVLAIHDAMAGKPLTDKYLSVAGRVPKPSVLHVPVGTSFAECVALAGGELGEGDFIVAGGPMMGRSMTWDQAKREVVTKTTSGILVLPADGAHAQRYQLSVEKMLNRARSACIQCSYCTQLCPRYLLGHPLRPNRIMRKLSMGAIPELLEDEDVKAAQLCCECGICELYACPMGLAPRRVNQLVKGELAKAGIRSKFTGGDTDPDREVRKAPTRKAAARAGVLEYYDWEPGEAVEYTPRRVAIPVKMHIGAPSQPVVAVGDRVERGQLIARCPEGAMGAQIHASITGVVAAVGDRIVIESR